MEVPGLFRTYEELKRIDDANYYDYAAVYSVPMRN